jgi:hypothetical protein
MTSFADIQARGDALALGVHVLDKPFSLDTLRRVATLLILSKRIERSRDDESALRKAQQAQLITIRPRSPRGA